MKPPYLGQHWRVKPGVESAFIGNELILNGGDNWHLGPWKCSYELCPMAPADQFTKIHVENYEALVRDYEPTEQHQ